jgi:hypothetical protein
VVLPILHTQSLQLERLDLTSGIEIVGQFVYVRHRGCENDYGDYKNVFWLNDQDCGIVVEVSEISRAAIRKSLFQSSSKFDLGGGSRKWMVKACGG